MIFILGISLGLTALILRSAVAIAGTGIMIVVAFAAAALLSGNGVHAIPLLIALAGYNAGIAGGFVAMMAAKGKRTA